MRILCKENMQPLLVFQTDMQGNKTRKTYVYIDANHATIVTEEQKD